MQKKYREKRFASFGEWESNASVFDTFYVQCNALMSTVHHCWNWTRVL